MSLRALTRNGVIGCTLLGIVLGLAVLVIRPRTTAAGSATAAPYHAAAGHAEEQQPSSRSSNIPVQPHTGPHKQARVDGAIQPELIPDYIAQLEFVRSASPSVGTLGLKKSRAYIRAKLKIIDRVDTAEANSVLIDRIVTLVRAYDERLKRIKEQAQREATPNAFELYKQDSKQLVAEFTAAMIQQLGPDGELRMQAAVRELKSKTRLF